MPKKFDPNYRVKDGTTRLGEAFFNPVFQDIDARIASVEAVKVDWEAAVADLTEQGLLRINGALGPIFADLEAAAALGFLQATSASSLAFSLGATADIVLTDDAQGRAYVPTPHVIVTREATAEDWAACLVTAWDDAARVLSLTVIGAAGNSGPHTDLVVSATAATTLAALQSRDAATASAAAAEGSAITASAASTASEGAAAAAEASAAVAAVSEAGAQAAEISAIAAKASAEAARDSAAATLTAAGLPGSVAGWGGAYLRVTAAANGYELRNPAQTLADLGAAAASHSHTLADLGAAAASHSHSYIPLAGSTEITGDLGQGVNTASTATQGCYVDADGTVTVQALPVRAATWPLYQGYSGSDDTYKVQRNGNVLNTNNSYGSLSDERLKEVIGPARDYTDDFLTVEFCKFLWKSRLEEPAQLGVLAQALARVFPGLVEHDQEADEYAVKYSVLSLIAGVVLQHEVRRGRERDRRITTLEAQVAALDPLATQQGAA